MSPLQEIRRAELRRTTLGMETCGKPSHSRYVSGCRCDACKEANRLYAQQYAKRSRERVSEAADSLASKLRDESRARAEAMAERLREELAI